MTTNSMKRYKVMTRVLLGEANLTLTPDDVIEFDGVAAARVNGRDMHLPSLRHGISKQWIYPLDGPAPSSSATRTDRAQQTQIVDNDQFALGTVKGREQRAEDVRAGRKPSSSSSAFAPPANHTSRSAKALTEAQDGYVIQEGIRIKTPAKMAKLDVTQHNAEDIERRAQQERLKEVKRVVREGITFTNQNISHSAAGVPEHGNELDGRSELWQEGVVEVAPPQVVAEEPTSDPSGLSEVELFQFRQIKAFIDSAPSVVKQDLKWELYALLQKGFPQLPSWDLKAHWRKKVATYNSLKPLYREVVRLFDDGVYLNHTSEDVVPAEEEDVISSQVAKELEDETHSS